jgi:hypothetical protein
MWDCEDIMSVWAKHEWCENCFSTDQFFACTIMLDQNNTPPSPDVELQFQMQAMTKMMESD